MQLTKQELTKQHWAKRHKQWIAILASLYLIAQVHSVAKAKDSFAIRRRVTTWIETTTTRVSCYPTTSYDLDRIDYDSGVMILQSYYGSKKKTMGGDEFYATIVQTDSWKESAIGYMSDLSNGQYALRFKSLLESKTSDRLFNITVENFGTRYGREFYWNTILQYSCGDGFAPPPSKEYRTDNGAINREIPVQYSWSHWLPIEQSVQSSSKPQIDLKQFDRVLAVGDSLMRQLVEGGQFAGRTISPPWTFTSIQNPLSKDLVEEAFVDVVEKACRKPNKGNTRLGDDSALSKENACDTDKTLLLLNSGLWDLLEDCSGIHPSKSQYCDYDTQFEYHLHAMNKLLALTRQIFPNLTIGWKSMTAAHVHKVDCANAGDKGQQRCAQRVKYMSTSRAETILQKQAELLAEYPSVLNLNLYNLTYERAHLTLAGDGRHYRCGKEDRDQGINVCLEMWNEAFGDSGWA